MKRTLRCSRCALSPSPAADARAAPACRRKDVDSGLQEVLGRAHAAGRRARRSPDIVASGVSFDEALKRLKDGRPYAGDGAEGRREDELRGANGNEYFYALNVPESYDPARRYQVRIQLHGGVSRETQRAARRRHDRRAGRRRADLHHSLRVERRAVVEPTAGREPPHDSRHGQAHLQRRREPRRASPACPTAARAPTTSRCATRRRSRASCRSTASSWCCASVSRAATLFPNNLRNKPFFIVNGGRDPLYPTRVVDPYVEHLKTAASRSSTSRSRTACTTRRGGPR